MHLLQIFITHSRFGVRAHWLRSPVGYVDRAIQLVNKDDAIVFVCLDVLNALHMLHCVLLREVAIDEFCHSSLIERWEF